jgi:hypothetical protein
MITFCELRIFHHVITTALCVARSIDSGAEVARQREATHQEVSGVESGDRVERHEGVNWEDGDMVIWDGD